METYLIRTFGCQMNKHDTERVAGLLADRGLTPSADPDVADVIVFMTCCVRENADERLRGQVASLKRLKRGRAHDPLIAVGGCIGQRDGQALLDRLPNVDVVFGTHNISSLPALLDAAAASRTPQVSILAESQEFSTDLPSQREHPWSAWVPITVGCDNFCSYCIVPHVRGREKSRPLDEITAEVAGLVEEGVLEVTLLGQNVNSYGRDRYGEPRFADVLRSTAATGIPRIRFATSHPKDLSAETIRALAELDAVMPYLHLPVQSGSDRILAAMNRGYTAAHYRELVQMIRSAVPDISVSTDIIVGFPGETDEDFTATLELVRDIGFDQAFTFIYSPREGTPAASLPETVPYDIAQARLEQLVEVVQASSLARKRRLVGRSVDVLFEGASKRDDRVLTGRTPDNTVAHVPLPEGRTASDFAGRILPVLIDEAQTWFVSGRLVGRQADTPAAHG